MVAFCSGINLAQVPSWVADDIDSRIDWDGMLTGSWVLLLFFAVIRS